MKPTVRSDVLRRQAPRLHVSRLVLKTPQAEAPIRLPGYRRPAISLGSSELLPGTESDPYVDFGNFLTDAGGIKLSFKDIDRRWRHTLWRILAWVSSTGGEGWYLLHHSPLHARIETWLVLLACAVINWLVVRKPVEIYRTVEIRPDCLIIDGADLFWRRHMEVAWPRFAPAADGSKVLTGIYGTRLVEFFTVPRFDEFDRSPDVLETHMQRAMQQLWAHPQS